MTERKPTLLVVDDEIDQCDSIKSYFSKRNFLVFTANTGEEALSLIRENKPDLVLLDVKLNGNMNGKDVLRILRESDKDTKIALITGDILIEQEMQEIADLGVVDFLRKPVDMQTLEGIIKKVLQENYPAAIRLEEIKPTKDESPEVSLRRIAHDCNATTLASSF